MHTHHENDTDILYWVALQSVPGLGQATYRKLIDAFGDPRRVIEGATSRRLASLPRIAADVRREVLQVRHRLPQIAGLIRGLRSQGVSVVPFADDAYPVRLRHIQNPPMLLYVRGGLPAPSAKTIATRWSSTAATSK